PFRIIYKIQEDKLFVLSKQGWGNYLITSYLLPDLEIIDTFHFSHSRRISDFLVFEKSIWINSRNALYEVRKGKSRPVIKKENKDDITHLVYIGSKDRFLAYSLYSYPFQPLDREGML